MASYCNVPQRQIQIKYSAVHESASVAIMHLETFCDYTVYSRCQLDYSPVCVKVGIKACMGCDGEFAVRTDKLHH